MSINLDTNLHTNVRVLLLQPYSRYLSLEEYVKYWKKHREFSIGRARFSRTGQFITLANAALYANDMGINSAEHLDIVSYMIGQGLYSGRLRDALAAIGVSVEKFDEARNAHLEAYKRGIPVFRKDPIVIDIVAYITSCNAGKITTETNIKTAVAINEALMNLIDSFEKEQECTLMAEDEWYPDDISVPVVHQYEPDFSKVPENDNCGFVHLENKDDDAVVVEVLPNKQKLVKLIKRDGNVHYIVVGEDVDVARLPKIYSMFLRDELSMGCNITTDRLTRILKINELLEAGFTGSETAEYLDVPKHIVYSDTRILKKIEILNNK